MKKILPGILILLLFLSSCKKKDEKTVFLSILARNKEAVLPKYLRCIESLEYDKKLIVLYINTNNNEDDTEQLLKDWVRKNKKAYRKVIFESHHCEDLDQTNPHDWNAQRFSKLAMIRNKTLDLAKKMKVAYYFVVDCDNFIAPSTLKVLIEKDKPIIAPMLYAIPVPSDNYSNFFAACSPTGYFQDDPEYWQILRKSKVGTIEVPLVHCTYLIQQKYLDRLSYTDETNDYEFVIFSRNARKANIGQYICNEEDFGVLVHFYENLTLEEENKRVANILRLPPM